MSRSGTHIGTYEIVGLLGVGGMGEVYRARDPRLKRDVAIKVLPAAVAHDPDRLARFQREAETLATLNHPNVAAVYGLEELPGSRAIVLELVEGDTLEQRIAASSRRGLPLAEALAIGRQIADALEAAHERGIVHRDLKPANIKIGNDGRVKILDFGLAKMLDPADHQGAPTGATQSPTMTAAGTVAGVLLGTAAYMSPEQARGKPVDRRADIWAFGCVLYEMLTGRAAFAGDSITDVLSSITRDDPDWTALPAATPGNIATLLHRCFQKDLQKRIPHVGIAKIEIDEARSSPAIPTSRSAPLRVVAVPWIIAGLAAAVVVTLAIRGQRLRPPSSVPAAIGRFPIVLPADTTLFLGANTGQVPRLALSRDGTRMVFTARRGSSAPQLYIRSLDQLEATPLRGPANNPENPFFSWDGQWIAFVDNDGALKKVPVGGGVPATIANGVGSLRGAAWLRDDSIVFAIANAGRALNSSNAADLLSVPAVGGTPTVRVKHQDNELLRWPSVLPDGKTLLYVIQQPGGGATSIAAVRLDTGQRRILMQDGTAPEYVSPGFLVFARSGTLAAARFDAERLEVTTEPVEVLQDVSMNLQTGAVQFAAGTASAVYLPGAATRDERTLQWTDRHGTVTPIRAAPRRRYEFPRISPDNRRVALTISSPNGDNGTALRDVWLYDFARDVLSRVTFQKEEAETPVWLDATHITYVIGRSRRDIVVKATDGNGEGTTLASTDHHLHAAGWSPDHSALVFAVPTVPQNGSDGGSLWWLRAGSPATVGSFLRSTGEIRAPSISPDGRWILYSSNETHDFEVFIQSFPALGTKYQVSNNGGSEPKWTRSGRELVYLRGDTMVSVAVTPTRGGLEFGRPVALFDAAWMSGGYAASDSGYDVTGDGERFLTIKRDETPTGSAIVAIQNWSTELQTRVPTGQR